MTIRDRLNRRIVPAYVVMLICFVLFGASGFFAGGKPGLAFLPLIPFAGFGACILFLYYGVRCPKCRNSIAYLTYLPGGGAFRLSRHLQFCPFCGVSFDTEVDKTGQPDRCSGCAAGAPPNGR
jgi:hypothetical protein